MTISAPGIGSNLDVNSIVSQLMQIEQQPLTLLDQKEAGLQARLSAIGTIKGALSTLQGAAQNLAGVNTVSFRTNSSDSSAVGASASTTATPGAYSVNVTQLAQAQRLIAAGQASSTAAIGGGSATTLTISFGTISGGTFATGSGTYTGASFSANTGKTPFTVIIGATNNTLEGIRDAINSANHGVTASIVNDGSGTPYRLALSVQDTGGANSLKIDVAGEAAISTLLANDPAGTQNLAQTQAAQNAALTVDGIAITSATNTVADAIQGVTLTLARTTVTPVSVSVARDLSAASTAVAGLVQSYKDLNSTYASATGKGATLQGDGSVLGIQRRVRSAIGNLYGSSGAFRTLSSLGVSFQRDGTLTFDASKLDAALAADSAGTLATLAGAGSALNSIADSALGSNGVIDADTSGVNASINDIGNQRIDIQRRLDATEQRYRTQFAALDALLGTMNQTSSFLQQQFAASANISNTTRSR